MINRTDTWEEGLARVCRARAGEPFQWGVNDCLRFALLAVEGMTGREAWQHPQCSTAREAERYLRAHGGIESLVARIARRGGWAELKDPQRQCSRGDLALFENDLRLCVGIVDGGRILCPSASGLAGGKINSIRRGWHLPFKREEPGLWK